MSALGSGQLENFLRRDDGFLREMWSWFAAGSVVVILRFAVRIRMAGLKGLRGDDFFMLVGCVMYTICFVMIDLVYRYGTNVDITAEQIDLLSRDEVARLVEGSKFQQVAWYSYTAYLWSMKGSLLFFYKRLTFDVWQHASVLRYITWFTVASYVVVVGTVTFGCVPFQDNWGVRPLPSKKCVFKPQNLLVTTFLSESQNPQSQRMPSPTCVPDVLTDAAILSLPLPVLKEIRVSLYKKMFIAVLICSGLFVIAAAIMRVAVTLGSAPSTITVNRWGVVECEIGLMAINAPILRPLFSRRFWQWHYQPPRRESNPMMSVKGSRTTIGRRRRVLKEDSLLGWMSAARSRVATVVGTRRGASPSRVDEETGEIAEEQELEHLQKDGRRFGRRASGILQERGSFG
ncbi:hypothetical protein CTRI78_v000383 [Colletotrichum trifolii]|uniref:Rhodopsin domain-containing protein n=1 Tax=Colletotrichum trifolii TaxID=5466 RepID=A0A4R8RW77_COLTR|nr:hypothetical protein CTRI78_v000383 [Colletotrichum trifolii]